MLLLCLIEVAINHLKDGVLGINLSIVILLVDLDLLFELFSFGDSHDFTPVSKNLHPVEVCHLLLLVHRIFQISTPDLHLLLLLGKVFDALVLVADLDESALLIGCRGLK